MTDQITASPNTAARTINAWLILLGENALLDDFSLKVVLESSNLLGIQDEDGILIVERRQDKVYAVAFARIFRKRRRLNNTTLYFDGLLSIESPLSIENLEIPPPEKPASITRLDWELFEKALKKSCELEWAAFPVLSGENVGEQAYVRELMQDAVVDDLLGPANGPEEEIIGMSVRDRYLVGKLAPVTAGSVGIEGVQDIEGTDESGGGEDFQPYEGRHQPGQEFASEKGGKDSDDEETQEVGASTNQSLVPSSMGLTFCIAETVEKVKVGVRWGRYIRTVSEKINEKTDKPYRCWKRIPSGGKATIDLSKRVISPFAPDPDCPEVLLQGDVSAPLPNGDKLVTVFIVNGQVLPDQNQDEAWLFQPEMIVHDLENRPVFRRRPVLVVDETDTERAALEMIYRNHIEFAVGHGTSVHAIPSDEAVDKAVEIRTAVLPEYEVPVTETPGSVDTDRLAMKKLVSEGLLDMERLSEMEKTSSFPRFPFLSTIMQPG